MSEINLEGLNKRSLKKGFVKPIGQDITYVCTTCGNVEKEYALNSRNHKFCGKCSNTSVKSTLLNTLNWVNSTVEYPEQDYSGE